MTERMSRGAWVQNAYCPTAEAERLGVEVLKVDELGLLGEYRHDERRIYLQAGQPPRQERCTLTHEVVHAAAGDEPLDDLREHRRRERATDRAAARRLIDLHDLAEALLAHGGVPRLVAIDLNVTEQILEHRIASLHPAEKHSMRRLVDESSAETA